MVFPSTPRVFISYARKDGEEFAARLRQRLEREEPEITLWQDRAKMEGGVGWWKQITDALDQVEFLVIVMTPAAMQSEISRKEWHYARQQGICVYPVKGVPDAELDYQSLPSWMRRAHFFDLGKEWGTFVNHLKSPCQATRVPFMAPDPPTGFVQRPGEYNQLFNHLLDLKRENPVAITTALRGAGGFGKTALATALCHDEDVITAFDDGILWATLGEKPNVQQELTKLYAALTGERPGFVDVEDAAHNLAQKLEDKICLIVIDDVWDPAHLKPFLRGGKSCARLITTRQFEIAADAKRVDVNEMQSSEAVQMLMASLQSAPRDLAPFQALAKRLGEWPLLLKLAGSALKQRMERGDTLERTLVYLNKALDRRGATAFDKENPSERHQAVAATVAVSLDLLSPDQRQRYQQLAIFPEDVDIPLAAVGTLWGIDEFDTEDLAQRLDNLSLLEFHPRTDTISLHDVMRSYLASHLTEPAVLHAGLLDRWGDLYRLPDSYAWRYIAHHLIQAERREELRKLLFDFNWLQAKLEAADVNALITDYDILPNDPELQLVQGALRLSARVLARDKTHLAGQLLGRLLSFDLSGIQSLLEGAKHWNGAAWLRPLWARLTPPGGPLFQILGGQTYVNAVALLTDREWAIAASGRFLTVWNLKTGREVRTLTGHLDHVTGVAVTLDGQRVVSASDDGTLKIWDLKTGEDIRTIEIRAYSLNALAVTPDGRLAIVATHWGDLEVWDLETGEQLRSVSVHKPGVSVTAAVILPDGARAISASYDGTLKIWDIETGTEIRTLRGHNSGVTAMAVTPDGRLAVAGSSDGCLKVWDLESGTELRIIDARPTRHERYGTVVDATGRYWEIYAVAVTEDGKRAISASRTTLTIWDLENGREIPTLSGHVSPATTLAFFAGGRRVLSASKHERYLRVWNLEDTKEQPILAPAARRLSPDAVITPKQRAVSVLGGVVQVWNLESGAELRKFSGCDFGYDILAVAADAPRAICLPGYTSLTVWDLERGVGLFTLQGHRSPIMAVAVTADGHRAASVERDAILKVWDLDAGTELRTLMGHRQEVMECVAITMDGRRAISGSQDGMLKVWDLEGGTLIHTLAGHSNSVRTIAVAEEAGQVISGSDDGTLKVWELESGACLRTVTCHIKWVTKVMVTLDARRAVSASLDEILRLWDLRDGKLVATFYGERPFRPFAISPDGNIIMASDDGGAVHHLRLKEPAH